MSLQKHQMDYVRQYVDNVNNYALVRGKRGYSLIIRPHNYIKIIEDNALADEVERQLLLAGVTILDEMPRPLMYMCPIGYFREVPHHHAPNGVSLNRVSRPSGSDDESQLVSYLRRGLILVSDSRPVCDVLAQSGEVIATQSQRTDGEYAWPDDFAYYLSRYHVPLPLSFVRFARKSNYQIILPEQHLPDCLPPTDCNHWGGMMTKVQPWRYEMDGTSGPEL